jgi:hypothetical protein
VKKPFSLWRSSSLLHQCWLNRHREAVWCVLWCIRHGYWRSIDARWSWYCLCFMIAWTPWRALPHPWPRALDCCSYIESLEALSVGKSSAHIHQSQKPKVSFHSTWFEHEVAKMARTDQGLWVVSPLLSRQGQCGCGRPKSQTSIQ